MSDIKIPNTRTIQRPLSPHLQIYRWSWTMAMSVAHRITGVALYGGTLLLAIWLISLASGKASYEQAQMVTGSVIGRLILFGYTWALLHHMLGGLRHFIWDLGKGFDLNSRMNLARVTLIGSLILTCLVWAIGYSVR